MEQVFRRIPLYIHKYICLNCEEIKSVLLMHIFFESQLKSLRLLSFVFLEVVTEAAVLRCYYKKVFCKYAANLQESTHAEVAFQLYSNRTSAWVLSCKFAAYL